MKIKNLKGKQHFMVKLQSDSKSVVDREKGIITGVSVITEGEARGHNFLVDQTMSDQVLLAMTSASDTGVLSFYKHESWMKDFEQLGTKLGRMKNSYRDGDKIRADFHFSKGADKLPGLGNVRAWLEDEVEDDPSALGLSIAFFFDIPEMEKYQEENPDSPLVGRLKSLESVDWVGKGAANPDGLFSTKTENADNNLEDEEMKAREYLISLGLKKDATDAEMETFIAGLKADKLAEVKRLAALVEEPEVIDDPEVIPDDVAKEELARLAAAKEAGAKEAEARLSFIADVASTYKLSAEWVTASKENRKLSETDIKLSALVELEKANPRIVVGADRTQEGLDTMVSDAILLKFNNRLITLDPVTKTPILDAGGKLKIREPHNGAMALKNRSLVDIGRAYFKSLGVHTDGFDNRGIAEMMLRPNVARQRCNLAMSTSDFDYILQDALNKTLLASYMEHPTQWPLWCTRGVAPDFKTIHRIRLSAVGNLRLRPEGSEITYGSLSDAEEVYALAIYWLGLFMTEESIINDDMDAFSRIPAAMGVAAKRLEDVTAVAILNANANMADGNPLFDQATHANESAAAAVISETTLTAAELAIRTQTGLADEKLALMPSLLVVPPNIKRTAMKLMSSEYSPVANHGHEANTFQGNYTVIDLPELSSASEWYLMCDPHTQPVSTVEVGFLQGRETPQFSTQLDWDTDGEKFKIKHSVAAKALDWRGMFCNMA